DLWTGTAPDNGSGNALASSAGPRRRIVDDYADESTGRADLLAATRQALQRTANQGSTRPDGIAANAVGNSGRLSRLFAQSQVADIGISSQKSNTSSSDIVAPRDTLEAIRLSAETRLTVAESSIQEPQALVSQTSAWLPTSPSRKGSQHVALVDDPDTRILTEAIKLIRAQQPEEGLRLLDENEALERSARFYRIYGMGQLESGNAQSAISSLARSLSLDDSSALSYFLMGTSLGRLGRAADAEVYFHTAARLDPRFGGRPADNILPEQETWQ
ncbi:MAG: hypothetical protein MPJ50_15650, partial [Pirellulales bacterium]|nr:hypothetical protein [Pirellulales bacterium]